MSVHFHQTTSLFHIELKNLAAQGDADRAKHHPLLFIDLLNHIRGKARTDRRMLLEQDTKFHVLESAEIRDCRSTSIDVSGQELPIHFEVDLLFWSGKYNSRPPLVDADSLESRENDKSMREAEVIITHMVAKVLENKIIVAREAEPSGVYMGTMCSYFEKFTTDYLSNPDDQTSTVAYSMNALQLFSKDFIDRINNARSVKFLEVKATPTVLGGEFRSLCESTLPIDVPVVLTIGGNRQNLIATVFDLLRERKEGNIQYEGLRARISDKYDEAGSHDQWISPGEVAKMTWVNVKLDQNGMIDSSEMFGILQSHVNTEK